MAALRRINQDDLRNHNLSVVIDILLRTTEPLSRAELAKRTGLTKATMSLLVSMLVDDGVVREGEPSVQSSYGRPSTPLLIAGGRYCGIGLQVNTDGYGVIVLDLDGTVISERWVDADMSAPDADEVFAELNTLALEQEALLAERGYTVAGAGLALPGLVTGDMRLLMARNLGWEQLDLTRFDVMRRLDVTAGNEANMAALAQIPGYAMRRDGDGRQPVKHGQEYVFFSADHCTAGEANMLDEYTLTCSREVEFNQLYIIFSSKPFTKPLDEQQRELMPHELTYQDFVRWLGDSRKKDTEMTVEVKDIRISQ